MGKLTYNGIDIRELIEFTESSEITDGGVFSYSPSAVKISGILTSSSEHSATVPSSDYIYANTENCDGKLMVNGVPVSLSKIGYRPDFTTKLYSAGAGDYYLNAFEDGEVWIGSVEGERSGVQLSTTAQKRKTFLIILHGAGGGGGSSKWGVFNNDCGGGGGGGGMLATCVCFNYQNTEEKSLNLYVGAGGAKGTNAGDGSRGSPSIIYDYLYYAGCGRGGETDGGSGGLGGGYQLYEEDQIGDAFIDPDSKYNYTPLIGATGASGKSQKNTSTSTSAVTGTKYIPEGGTFTYSTGYSTPSRTGSGDASGPGGCGYAGAGGGSVGDGQTGRDGETSGGGSGGGNKASNNLAGGTGGDGYLEIWV